MTAKPQNKREWDGLFARVSSLLAVLISLGVFYGSYFARPEDVKANERRINQLEEAVDRLSDINITLGRIDERLKNLEKRP